MYCQEIFLAALLAAVCLAVCSLTGCGGGGNTGKQGNADRQEYVGDQGDPQADAGIQPYPDEITIMHVDAGNRRFSEYIAKAEKALNMKINVVECPINADSRHAKISLLLSSGDSSVDIITVNDEMISEFKYAGYLEPLQEDVMAAETAAHFPQDYLKQMVMVEDRIYSVPFMMDILAFWVNEAYFTEAGIETFDTEESFVRFLSHDWGKGCFSYGGAWEKTYVYNEIGEFINLFGGDYYDWNNEKTREAVVFLKNCVELGYSPKDQLLDQYEQVNQKFIDGKYGMIVTYSGAMNTFTDAGVYGPERIHLTPLPALGEKTTYVASWQYVLNKASVHKDAAKRFLAYAAGREGSIGYAEAMNRMPARIDVALEENLDVTGYDALKSYLKDSRLQARPLPQNSIEYISSMGTLFQKYVTGELDLEEYCGKMQSLIDENLIQ